MEEKRLTIYDSTGRQDKQAIRNLWRYLNSEYVSKTNKSMPEDWVYEHAPNTPLQDNGVDCGVFICLFADFISLNLPLIFDAQSMPNIRMRLAKLAIEDHADFSGVTNSKVDQEKIQKAWKTIMA
jgi:sentrin-specific protease 1